MLEVQQECKHVNDKLKNRNRKTENEKIGIIEKNSCFLDFYFYSKMKKRKKENMKDDFENDLCYW